MAKYIDYYAELEVSENATLEDIKKAYRIKAQKTHPDRGGNAEDFKKVNEAYEILKDSEERKIYDAKRNAYLEKQKQKAAEPKAQDLKETIQPEKPIQPEDTNTSNDIFDNIVEAYKEVRQKEKEQTIIERYKLRKKTFPNTNIKVFDNFINIIGEVGFQLSKLKKEKDEDLTRYIIRNRFNLASALVLTLVFTNNSKTIDEQPVTEPPIIEVEQADNTIIYNYHIVEEGECLSQLAEMGHVSEEELKEVNGIDRNTIYAGEELIIPFSISDDLLDDYTETIEVNGTSLEELVYKYKTDIYSLKVLNGDAITEDNKVLTNELLVPNFLTIDEYNNIDNKEYTYHN